MTPSKPHAHVVYAAKQWITLPDWKRDTIKQWLTANGIDPDGVSTDQPITITADTTGDCTIHYTVYLRDETGHRYFDPNDENEAAQEQRTTPLTNMPPPWTLDRWTQETAGGPWTFIGNEASDCDCRVGLEYQRRADREHGEEATR